MFRWLAALLLLLALAVGAAYLVAGRAAPPTVTIDKPDRVVGQAGALEVTASAPGARFTALTIALEQNGRSFPLFTLGSAPGATADNDGENKQEDDKPAERSHLVMIPPVVTF